jgi:hypothetical protein
VTRLATLFLLGAIAAPAQFLEFRIRFDDGGCVTCAESLKGRLERVRGVETVTLNLQQGIVELKLAADNGVRLAPLMSRIEQGAAKALKTTLVAKGMLIDAAGAKKIELQGEAAGQVYLLEGDTGAAKGPVIVHAQVLDAAAGRLRVESIRPAP